VLNIGVAKLMKSALLEPLKLLEKPAVNTTLRNNLDAGMSRLNPHFNAVSK
jgi:hypothetical protein